MARETDPTKIGLLALLEIEPWQMSTAERAYLVLLLSQLRPRRAVEVGSGGSTHVLRRFARRLTVVDPCPSPAISDLRLKLIERRSQDVLDGVVDRRVDFVLIDGDHSFEAVTTDVRACLGRPAEHRVLVLHDTEHPQCREAIERSGIHDCEWIHHVDLDAVPGENGWGGLGVAHLHPVERAAG